MNNTSTVTTQNKKVARPRKKLSQEKVMLVLALIFFVMVATFTMIPDEDSPLRAVLMPIFVGILTWVLYKWAM